MASSLNDARMRLQAAKKAKSEKLTVADRKLINAVRAQNKLRGIVKNLKARCLLLRKEAVVPSYEKIEPEKHQDFRVEKLQSSLLVGNQHETQNLSTFQTSQQNAACLEATTLVQTSQQNAACLEATTPVQTSQQSLPQLESTQSQHHQNFSSQILPCQMRQGASLQLSEQLGEPEQLDSEYSLPSSCSREGFSNCKQRSMALKRRQQILSRMKQQNSWNPPNILKKPASLSQKLSKLPVRKPPTGPKKLQTPPQHKATSNYNEDLERWKKKREEFLKSQKTLEPPKLKKLQVVLEDVMSPVVHYQAVTSLAFVQNSSLSAIDIKCLKSCDFKRSFSKVTEMRAAMNEHFKVHKDDGWNGFCSKCEKQVVKGTVKRKLSMREELEHILKYHTK